MLANTKLRHLHRLDICVCFANQLLLIANQFEIVEQNANRFEQSIFTTDRHCDISLVVVDIDVRLNLIVVRSLCGVVVVCTLEWAPIGWDRACADD